MSEEIIEDMLEEVAPQIAGDYPEIAQRYKAGEELTDEELDTIADVAISILRSILSHFDAANSPIDEYEGDEGELILDVTAPDLAVLIGRHGRKLFVYNLGANIDTLIADIGSVWSRNQFANLILSLTAK